VRVYIRFHVTQAMTVKRAFGVALQREGSRKIPRVCRACREGRAHLAGVAVRPGTHGYPLLRTREVRVSEVARAGAWLAQLALLSRNQAYAALLGPHAARVDTTVRAR